MCMSWNKTAITHELPEAQTKLKTGLLWETHIGATCL